MADSHVSTFRGKLLFPVKIMAVCFQEAWKHRIRRFRIGLQNPGNALYDISEHRNIIRIQQTQVAPGAILPYSFRLRIQLQQIGDGQDDPQADKCIIAVQEGKKPVKTGVQ